MNIYLVVILHQLNNYPYVIAIVLDGDYTHDICGIFSIRIRTIFVSKDKAGICFVYLK